MKAREIWYSRWKHKRGFIWRRRWGDFENNKRVQL